MNFQSTLPSTDPFLLHPTNHAFMTGQRRRVSDGSSIGCLALFMVLFVLFGAVFFVLTGREVVRWGSIEFNSAVTSGEFVERRIEIDDNTTHHYATFRYQHNDAPYEIEQLISEPTYKSAESGSKVDIRFVPANPQMAVIDGSNRFPIVIFIFVLVWNAIVLTITISVWRQYWLLRVLERNGILIGGTIVGSRTTTDSDGDLMLYVDYQFAAPDPVATITGSESTIRNDFKGIQPPTAGEAIQVLYHNPQHYMLL